MNATTPTRRTGWLDAAAAEFASGMPAHLDRLRWSPERIRMHQTERLRALLAAARGRSRFHRQRLEGVDPARFELELLASLPVMTKAVMMERFDDVVTDPRVTATAIDAHLASQGSEPTLLLDEYLALASGGSSGLRGVFVYHRDAVAPYVCSILRTGMARIAAMAGWPPPFPIPVTIVAAPSAIHATGSTAHLVRSIAELTFTPATLPFDEIVHRVRGSRPMLLCGYTSLIARLADEQAAGNLEIAPEMVIVTAEQLTPELRDRICAGFGSPPANAFASSEGLNASAPPGSDEFTFASDMAIVEFVDSHDQEVPAGEVADHVLVTSLINHAQPLIRYRLDDRMIPLPPASDHGHQRAKVEGRSDDIVRIGNVTVHPLTIRSAMLRHPTIGEYQVLVGDRALTLLVVPSRPVDVDALRHDVTMALAGAGAPAPSIEIRTVDQITRDPRTGKAKRFITI
ncbi:MAG: hypothetical protein ACRDY7_01800 [Acidimicrobiia bacterium]